MKRANSHLVVRRVFIKTLPPAKVRFLFLGLPCHHCVAALQVSKRSLWCTGQAGLYKRTNTIVERTLDCSLAAEKGLRCPATRRPAKLQAQPGVRSTAREQ